MTFTIVRTSTSSEPITMEISSLEELMEFQLECGYEIIINSKYGNEIEIYDDYRE